jgi:hypothetical protein
LVYGNSATELPLRIERFSAARGDTARRARLDWCAAPTLLATADEEIE